MKAFKRIMAWIMISLAIQFTGLFYLNNYYFSDETDVKSKKVDLIDRFKKSNIEIKIPDGIKHLMASYDGRYIAYSQQSTLKIINTETGKISTPKIPEGIQISYYKWLPDRDRMIIAEKFSGNKGNLIKFASYDVGKDSTEYIAKEGGEAIYINLPDRKSEVEDITLSTYTNVIYAKIFQSERKNSIYRINVMAEKSKIQTYTNSIGNIEIIPHVDKLLYEDAINHRVYVTGMSNYFSIKNTARLGLIAVDREDNTYLGQIENNKVAKIFWGNIKENPNKWEEIKLGKSVDKEDIYVSKDGNIYINNNLKGLVTEAKTGKDTVYSGEFVQMFNNGIVSLSDGKLIKTSFK